MRYVGLLLLAFLVACDSTEPCDYPSLPAMTVQVRDFSTKGPVEAPAVKVEATSRGGVDSVRVTSAQAFQGVGVGWLGDVPSNVRASAAGYTPAVFLDIPFTREGCALLIDPLLIELRAE